MNATTMNKRFLNAGLLTSKNELKSGYDDDLNRLYNYFKSAKESSIKLYLKTWSRSCGRYKLIDRAYFRTCEILQALKLKFETGNDAPRGGSEGDYILVSLKELRKIF